MKRASVRVMVTASKAPNKSKDKMTHLIYLCLVQFVVCCVSSQWGFSALKEQKGETRRSASGAHHGALFSKAFTLFYQINNGSSITNGQFAPLKCATGLFLIENHAENMPVTCLISLKYHSCF